MKKIYETPIIGINTFDRYQIVTDSVVTVTEQSMIDTLQAEAGTVEIKGYVVKLVP